VVAVLSIAVLSVVELSDFTRELRYCCQTCPYIYKITKKVDSQGMSGNMYGKNLKRHGDGALIALVAACCSSTPSISTEE
jgi:hypothetical protein